MNCKVRADFPTPPLPTMITLWRTRDVWLLFLPEAMTLACRGQEEDTGDIRRPAGTRRMDGMGENRLRPVGTCRNRKRQANTGRNEQGRDQRGQEETSRERTRAGRTG